MVEVTLRTVHSRMLLRPGPALNDLIAGVLGRAQRKYDMRVHGTVVLSNHAHLDLTPESPQHLAAFMGFAAGNIAREVGRTHDWKDKLWARRYRAVVISDEEAAQVARLRYLLANAVKEGLVERPDQWPGIHCAVALRDGTAIEGTWFNRTAEYEARRRGEDFTPSRFAETERLVFEPIPSWAHLSPREYRARIAELIEEIVEAAKAERAGRPVVGREAIQKQHPHERPAHTARSPAPAFHAATKAARLKLQAAYRAFVAAFCEAARRLRRGDRTVVFPPGAFPPPLPCVIDTC